MKVMFRVRIADPSIGKTRRFTFKDELPYPGVPRVCEGVILTTKTPNEHLGARRVAEVQYVPDGTVVLDVTVDGLINDPKPQIDVLLEAGYTEQDPV